MEQVELRQPEPAAGGGGGGDGDAAEVNTLSADDGRYMGKTTDEVLSEFVFGSAITGSQRDKFPALLTSFRSYFLAGTQISVGTTVVMSTWSSRREHAPSLYGRFRFRGLANSSLRCSLMTYRRVARSNRVSPPTGIRPLFWSQRIKDRTNAASFRICDH